MFRIESFPSCQGCSLFIVSVPGLQLQTGPCMASGWGLPHDRSLSLVWECHAISASVLKQSEPCCDLRWLLAFRLSFECT